MRDEEGAVDTIIAMLVAILIVVILIALVVFGVIDVNA